MLKFYFLLLFLGSTAVAYSQENKRLRGYLSFQYIQTLKDLTKGNNPWGVGSSLGLYWPLNRVVMPVAEIGADLYLMDDKVLRIGLDGEKLQPVEFVTKILSGPSLQIGPFVNAACIAGPSFINGDAYFTIKPSVHIFVGARQSAFIKVSYIYINKRGNTTKLDFISYSIGFGFKVF